MQRLDIPHVSPFKFYESKVDTGIHFDDDWTYNQIKSFERRVIYKQKMQRGDATPFQVWCSALPGPVKVLDCDGVEMKSIAFIMKIDGGSLGYNIYEAVIDIDDLADGIYYLYSQTVFFTKTFKIISEPIHLKNTWLNTMLFSYKHSYNDYGVIFTTGLEYKFRCEAGIMDFQPDAEITDYIDQIHNVEILSGTPFRTFKLYIADEKGVPPYIIDILNRIFCCDHVVLSKDGTNGKRYVKPASAKWEVNRVKGYPHYGASTEILEAMNLSSLQLNSTNEDAGIPGLITTYNHEVDFWGAGLGPNPEAIITEITLTP